MLVIRCREKETFLLMLLNFAIKHYFVKDKSGHILLNTVVDQSLIKKSNHTNHTYIHIEHT